MSFRRVRRRVRVAGAFALGVLMAAALGVLACSSGSSGEGSPAAGAGETPSATQSARSTPTPEPPKVLQLVESYNPESFPAFSLPKAGGGELNSADYIGKQPVAVVFYRGNF